MDPDDVQPVEKVRTEQPPLHLLLQIAVSGHQQTEIQLNALGAGHPLDGLFLNELQQLGLNMRRQLSDLIQKQGTVVGQLDLTNLTGRGRAGKGSLFIAEQLGFNEVFMEHRAVDLDKGAVGPVADGVDGLGHRAFAHAGLPGDENVGLRVGGVQDQCPQPLHGRALHHQIRGGGPEPQFRDLLRILLQGVL